MKNGEIRIYRYIPRHDAAEWNLCGWNYANPLPGNHGRYSVLMWRPDE